MEDTIKEQVNKCLEFADEIEASGIIKDNLATTFRENLKYEFLKFLAYLTEKDGLYTKEQEKFIL
ncbi:MAG: stage V sporulation protein K, partial [Butyrivibrio sp.]